MIWTLLRKLLSAFSIVELSVGKLKISLDVLVDEVGLDTWIIVIFVVPTSSDNVVGIADNVCGLMANRFSWFSRDDSRDVCGL